MFKNIGKKIKLFAVVSVYISLAIFLWLGIYIMLEYKMYVVGIITIILGVLASWISQFLLYGFGELVDKTTEIANNSTIQLIETANLTTSASDNLKKIKATMIENSFRELMEQNIDIEDDESGDDMSDDEK